ncbi:MAG: ABC transporter ATP-binding protein [Planctomycetes bacterium]|nr:ABC transporter ATP-binding protein [Planctomycetota bacterium]
MAKEKSKYAIETFALTKIFPDWWGRAKVVAVDNLDLQIKHNEVYGLLGPNGSGKTTTMKILLSLLHPSKGAAQILGGSSRDPKISDRVGYLPEESYLYKYLTARETLDFYGRIFGLSRKVRKARIDDLLEMVGLTPMANRQVGTYSKGMARRIGLAQALINDPDVLILDEPTSGMDPIGTRQMKDMIIQFARRGKTVMLCSHLLADVEDVCDRIGILYGGRMQTEGTVDSLLQKTDQKQIVTSAISDKALGQIREIIKKENADCDISSPMDRLEEFFIRTVASAQQANQPTSGAVNTGQISGFLTEQKPPKEPEKGVLDELVSATVESEAVEPVAVSKPAVVEVGEQGPKSDLLDKLTKTAVVEEPGDVVGVEETTDAAETAAVEEIGGSDVNSDLLNKLINKGDGSTDSVEGSENG